MMSKHLFLPALAVLMLLICRTATAQNLSVETIPSTINAGTTLNLNFTLDTMGKALTGVQFTVDLTHENYEIPPLTFGTLTADQVTSPLFPTALVSTNPDLTDAAAAASATQLTVAIASTVGKKGTGRVFTVPIHIPELVWNGTSYSIFINNTSASGATGQSIGIYGNRSIYFKVVSKYPQYPVTVPYPGPVPSPSLPPPTLRANDPQPDLKLTDGAGVPGGTASVEINSSASMKGLNGIQFDLDFDPALTARQDNGDFKIGAAIPNGYLVVNDQTPGKLDVALARALAGTDPANVLTILFHVPSSASVGTEYPITLSNVLTGGVYFNYKWNPTAKITVVGTPELPKFQDGGVFISDVRAHEGEAIHVIVNANSFLADVTDASFTLDANTRSPETVPPLQFVNNVTPGGMLAGAAVTADDSTPGVIRVHMTGGAGGIGDGLLADIPVILPADLLKNTAYRLALQDVQLTIGGTVYRVNTSNGLLIVKGRRRGDVANVEGKDKGNGRIDIVDSIALLRIILRDRSYLYTSSQYEAADVNCDNQVVISDVVSVLRVLAGLQTKVCDP